MKKIYVVLIKAHTGLGCFARLFSGYGYTHIAVSLSPEMTDFLSFSRRRHYLPADAGFMHEKRDFYAFGSHKAFKAKIFALDIPDENYRRIRKFIAYCEKDKALEFNLFSMMTMPIIHGFPIPKTYNCMSFTAKILKLSGLFDMPRSYRKYSIPDMDMLMEKHCIFEGYIPRTNSDEYADYMKKCSPTEYIRCTSRLIASLAERMIFGIRKE